MTGAILTAGLGSFGSPSLMLTLGYGESSSSNVPGCPDEFRTVVTVVLAAASSAEGPEPSRTRVTWE